MTEWAYMTEDSIEIDWSQVFDNAMNYDAGDKCFDARLAKLITMVQRYSFERGFEAGCNAKHPQERLLAYTGGQA
jgi:hypothetical protein